MRTFVVLCLAMFLCGCHSRTATDAQERLASFEIVCKPEVHMSAYDPSQPEAYVETYWVMLMIPGDNNTVALPQLFMLPEDVILRLDASKRYTFRIQPGRRIDKHRTASPEILEVRHKGKTVYKRADSGTEPAVGP